MKYTAQKSSLYTLFLTAFLCFTASSVTALIQHPDGEPNLTTWTSRPHNDVIGRWNYNGTCVAISSNCVITVRHTYGGIGVPVEIGGKTYYVTDIWNHSIADLRIAKLQGANLAHFVDLYTNTDERYKSVVIGGYGSGWDSLLQTGGVTYGYDWESYNNNTLRFGTNKINYTISDSNVAGFISDVIAADFDDLGVGGSTTYESTTAAYDSGGGWFINSGGNWKVAGLTRAVEHSGQSWFRKSSDPNVLDPDYFDAVRISSYDTWIYTTMPPRLPGELTGDDWVDFADFAVFTSYWLNTDCHAPDWCLGCDFEPDGDVDWEDLAIFTYYWLTGESPL